MYFSFAEQIKIILERREMTITDFADIIGMSRQNLSQKLRRNNFQESEMIKIAGKLGYEFTISLQEINPSIQIPVQPPKSPKRATKKEKPKETPETRKEPQKTEGKEPLSLEDVLADDGIEFRFKDEVPEAPVGYVYNNLVGWLKDPGDIDTSKIPAKQVFPDFPVVPGESQHEYEHRWFIFQSEEGDRLRRENPDAPEEESPENFYN